MNINELEELAKAATTGPWWIDSHGSAMVSEAAGHQIVFITDPRMGPSIRHEATGNLSHWRNDSDASYIAAANPSAILELIAAYKEAVAALVISRPFINAWPQCRDNELVIVDSALATAKRLGVE